ncbi:MAG: hypothetical protein A3E84_04825 [Gammaproteobacteria bacterium RIFCSPHIGHO2_12_FULL_42_13]|nr:MAG: hypothetical protein A3E84_04825 [Gammaproteobacteria bacterium RIFCSPHIGHO2_12_FULL_42_13]
MPIQTLNNIHLYYEQHGKGPDLVLIGGLSSDHQVWRSPLRIFSQHFRVLIFDNRGAGRSSTPDYPYTIEMMANDTIELMDALHIEKAHILGHSMGGGIAMQMALLAPKKINKLIVVSSRPCIGEPARMYFAMREKLKKQNISEGLLAEYMMPILFGEKFLSNQANVKGFAQWTVRNPNPQSMIGYHHQLHASSTRDISGELHNISAETLLVNGTEDALVPYLYAQNLAKKFQRGKLVTLPECGHMPHVEYPEKLAEVVMEFIQPK